MLMMSSLCLGPNWIILLFEYLHYSAITGLHGPSSGYKVPGYVVKAEQDFNCMGASEQDTARMALYCVDYFRLFPDRSGLGRNSVGSTYRGLLRERTALRALILCTPPSYLP